MIQWIVCVNLLLFVGGAIAQTTTEPAQETLVTWIQSTGKKSKLKLDPIALGKDWKPVQIIRSLERIQMAPRTLSLRIQDREQLASATRVVLQASYDGLPLFDRDVVAIVSKAGTIKSVRVNLPRDAQPKAATIPTSAVGELLNSYLLERFGPANVTPSPTQRLGWLAFGEHLYPISEVDVVDPIRFRHFTARIDRTTGRVISVTERTMN